MVAGGRRDARPLRLWTVLLVLVVLGAIAGISVSASSRPLYTATNSSFVASRTDRVDLGERPPLTQDLRKSYSALATSPVVLDHVISTLGLRTTAVRLANGISAEVAGDQAVVRIKATDPSARRAAAVANAVQKELARQVASSGSTRLTSVDPAKVPKRPSSPSPALSLAMGATFGAAVWLLFIVLRLIARLRRPERDGVAAPSMF